MSSTTTCPSCGASMHSADLMAHVPECQRRKSAFRDAAQSGDNKIRFKFTCPSCRKYWYSSGGNTDDCPDCGKRNVIGHPAD
jgi:hypothetical protein